MNPSNKRERSSNFQKTEVRLLMELVTKYRSLVETKKTDAASNKAKDAAWKAIAIAFNAASSGPEKRSPKTLKLKYESLKKGAKKKMIHRRAVYKTGGEPSTAPEFNEIEEKVLAICADISGLDASNDSDNTDNILEVIVNEEDDTINDRINESVVSNGDTEVTKDFIKKWSQWDPSSLSKMSEAFNPTKSSITPNLDDLSAARLELIKLQIEIAKKEHAFVKEEHETKMLHLNNEEKRKQELHQLMLAKMQRKEPATVNADEVHS